MVTLIAGPTLNVTATMRDKTKKGIRIRKVKELEGTILSLTASQLACKPSGKHLLTGRVQSLCVRTCALTPPLPAYVDGLEWSGLSSLRLTAQWDQSPTPVEEELGHTYVRSDCTHLSVGVFNTPHAV